MKKFSRPAASPAGHGTPAGAFGRHVIRMMAANTGGTFGMFEAVVAPGEGPPLHVHEREEELFRVLKGRFGFWCAGDYLELTAGGCIALPRGIPHRFENIGSEDGELMVIVTPGGFEAFFPMVELCKPETPEQVAALAGEFGVTFVPAEGQEAAA